MSLDQAVATIEAFQGESLTTSLSSMESKVVGLSVDELDDFCSSHRIDAEFMSSALKIKKVAGQINVIIHAAGIIRSLPSLLKRGEVVQSVSLGAGNTGRRFDLETNLRVAEYKFIGWQGGSETIRQNVLFKDFFELAEHRTEKEKYLYVVGTEIPLKFFRSGRSLASVLSRRPALLATLKEKYGETLQTVGDYYKLKEQEVQICDISPHIGRNA